jgi:hypothetical protein
MKFQMSSSAEVAWSHLKVRTLRDQMKALFRARFLFLV